MRATERRQALLEIICERRHEKMDNLAFELGVSRKTIIRDVLELSISYPIYTAAGRHDSGVFVEDDYYLGKQYLSDEQQELLVTMLGNCDENQKKTMLAIIKKLPCRFSPLKKCSMSGFLIGLSTYTPTFALIEATTRCLFTY